MYTCVARSARGRRRRGEMLCTALTGRSDPTSPVAAALRVRPCPVRRARRGTPESGTALRRVRCYVLPYYSLLTTYRVTCIHLPAHLCAAVPVWRIGPWSSGLTFTKIPIRYRVQTSQSSASGTTQSIAAGCALCAAPLAR